MPARHVARHTRLHPQLWGPYKITAYPDGFHQWPEGMADPVWEPDACVIRGDVACFQRLGDQPTLEDALEACWRHLASLPIPAEAA
ncbi:hypothetical protein [Sphingomonas bacterium]|uniref:hypothetical protein n=1 Tax=Sphingomonas bacterium TaxID=1895847 RepID=UPI0015766BD9|nr:hypothetical protein [Sphingomonas bacterium]